MLLIEEKSIFQILFDKTRIECLCQRQIMV